MSVTITTLHFRLPYRTLIPMSDKELALDSIRRLPEDAMLDTIAEQLEFLAAIRRGRTKSIVVKLCRMKK
jgi:hypothetical protein